MGQATCSDGMAPNFTGDAADVRELARSQPQTAVDVVEERIPNHCVEAFEAGLRTVSRIGCCNVQYGPRSRRR